MSQAPNKPQQNTLRKFEPAIRPPEQIRISQNSQQVLHKRYLRKGLDGEPVEDVEGMFRRVASAVAEPDAAWGYDVATTEESFYGLLADLRFFPNSPTFTGAATPLGQLAACFVLPISDDLGKRPDGIFQTLRDAALIQQTGGGNGFSFSRLRPKGDSVASSAGVASGPVGFLRVYDTAFGEVAQGGTRRGANMAILRVDHPDIEEFIACKESEGQISNFNISVGITDAFMKAVEVDEDFDLVSPRDGAVSRTVRARDLFETIVTFAHHNGEPGALFLDAANRSNPVPHLYELEATNPCGEQWLGPYENCCLGSVNLAQHVTEDGRVDWDKLRDSVVASTRFLDNVVDANKYVPAVPQLKEAAMRARRIGLGIMGLADLMYALGVRYGSAEGQEFASQVMEFARYHCMRTSIDLARERGPFPAIQGSIYDPAALKWQPPAPLSPYCHDWGRPPVDWDEITSGIRARGIRNAAQTTVAPTGTIGTVAGCEGYGCEPVFALAYTRTVKDGNRDLKLTYTSPLFEAALQRAGLDEQTRRRIAEHITSIGSCQNLAQVPDAIRRVFAVSQDITAEEHVRMQGAIQAFVDNSISKTINFPPGASVEDVAQAYRLAWRLGCKGLTVYVTGSRHEVVLETKATKEQKSRGAEETPTATQNGEESGAGEEQQNGGDAAASHSSLSTPLPPGHPVKRPRPAALWGVTYRKETPLGTAFVTVNINGGEYPFEVFLNVGKAGSDVAAVSEALGRLISLVLRLPSPLNPNERLKQVIDQLAGIGGGRSLGFGANRVRSLPDAVAQVLREHLNSHYETVEGEEPAAHEAATEQLPLPISDRPIGDLCPDCGQAAFIPTEGCRKCYACGYSEC
jgi:ribonucleoside-diphosphate reductase alpha chain